MSDDFGARNAELNRHQANTTASAGGTGGGQPADIFEAIASGLTQVLGDSKQFIWGAEIVNTTDLEKPVSGLLRLTELKKGCLLDQADLTGSRRGGGHGGIG